MLSACATRHHVATEYDHVLKQYPHPSDRTTIVFLIDGLSENTLNTALVGMPELRTFFRTDKQIFRAHTPFPSLTFPGIASLLTEKPVSKTGFIGNSFYLGDEPENFEKPADRKHFGTLMARESVFSRLRAQGKRSVSLDYGLGVNASAYSPIEDLSSVLNIAEGNYSYADDKKIESLYLLLSEYEADQWPSFIFIHLIGVDFLSHSEGPMSAKTIAYLISLDEKLKPLFDLLKEKESSHSVVTLLTADHGFAKEIKFTLNIEQVLSKYSKHLESINETRMTAVFVHDSTNVPSLAKSLSKTKGIEFVAYKTKTGFSIESATEIHPHPFLIENFKEYFSAANAPDFVVIPDSYTAFSKSYVGYHGGVTSEEVMVPLLMRNSQMSNGQAPPLWHLLRDVVQ